MHDHPKGSNSGNEEFRSLSAIPPLAIAAASPVLTVGAQALVDHIRAPKDEGPKVEIKPGTIRPEKDG